MKSELKSSWWLSGRFGRRLILWFLLVSILPLLITGLSNYNGTIESLTQFSQQKLQAVGKLKMSHVSAQIALYEKDLDYLALDEGTRSALSALLEGLGASGEPPDQFVQGYEWALIHEEKSGVLKRFQMNREYPDIWLMDLQGNLLYSAMDSPLLGKTWLQSIA